MGMQEEKKPLKGLDPATAEQAANELQAAVRWTGSIGAVAGLLAGVVACQALAALSLSWFSVSLAEMVWEIGSPLLALLGALGGWLVFVRGLRRNWLPALVVALVFLAVAAAVMAALGFPWMDAGQGGG